MYDLNLFLFLLLIVLGAVAQTMTGFAMGLIIMSGVAVIGIADIGSSAAIVSLVAIANSLFALRNSHQFIDIKYLKNILIGMLPCILLGVFLLDFLEDRFYGLLKCLLGFVTVVASILLIVKTKPSASLQGGPIAIAFGSLSGIISGIYSAGGAPIAYFMYRQPIELNIIRATLLAVFAVTLCLRSLFIFFDGGFSQEILVTSGIAIPMVILTTILTGKINHLIPDKVVKNIVSLILILTGGFLISTAL